MTTHCLGECISGAILYDETIRRQKKDGPPFAKAIADAGIIHGDLAWRGGSRAGSAASSIPSGQMQSGGARRGEYDAAMETTRA